MLAGTGLSPNGVDVVVERYEREEASRMTKRRKRSPLLYDGVVRIERIEYFVYVVATARDVDQTL